MTITTAIAMMMFFSFFIERTIEKFVSDPAKRSQKWLMFIALGAGIVIAFGFGIDAVSIFLSSINGGEAIIGRIPFLGTVLTGIAMGFGSTFIHDWLKAKEEPTVIVEK